MDGPIKTVTGDEYVQSLASFVRANEAKLSGRVQAPSSSSSSWIPGGQSRGPQGLGRPNIIPPKPLSISLHHLYYLLLRFDALGLPTGPLDESLPASLTTQRQQSTFAFISSGEQKQPPSSRIPSGLNAETKSIASVRSAISRMSVSAASTTSSWFSYGRTTQQAPRSPDADVKYLYSAFTKLPALDVVPAPFSGLIQGFEDAPNPANLVPADVFKNLSLLSLTDVDPRGVLGWDRLACQLRSLSVVRSVIEDVEELLVRQVAADAAHCAGAKSRHQDSNGADTEAGPSTSRVTPVEKPVLPSLAWQFLSNLSFPSSSLTFFAVPLLPSLRSLDLSHNLLNYIPPCLGDCCPNLQSIDLSGNLIEDGRGAREAIKKVRTLNLRGNRLESLSGFDGLRLLRKIDLRDNAIYEASEVGRLSQIDELTALWVRGNPVYDEYPDPRVEMLVEFAKEGWPLEGKGTIQLDGEVPGYFERGRVIEKLPLGTQVAPPGSSRPRRRSETTSTVASSGSRDSLTPRAIEGAGARSATYHEPASPQAVTVKHRHRHRKGSSADTRANASGTSASPTKQRRRAVKSPDNGGNDMMDAGSTSAGESQRKQSALEGQQGGNESKQKSIGKQSQRLSKNHRKRLVDLDYDEEAEGGATRVSVESTQQQQRPGSSASGLSRPKKAASQEAREELTEAEKLKRQVLSGVDVESEDRVEDQGGSVGGDERGQGLADESATGAGASITEGRPAKDTSELSAKKTQSKLDSASSVKSSTSNGVQKPAAGPPPPPASASAPPSSAEALRARIENLKREVGDDWMRVLSRGEG
ncbi:unnamed protein product [Jaminaea pallidilutea]